MASMVEDVTANTEKLEVDPTNVTAKGGDDFETEAKTENDKTNLKEENGVDNKAPDTDVQEPEEQKKEEKVEVIANEVEPKTGVSFPVKIAADGKQLKTFGLRKKSILGLGIKIYSFGLYADNEKLKELMRSNFQKAPAKPTKEMYQVVIDSDVGMMLRMVIVYGGLTMNMVKRNLDEGLGASIKKLNGGKKDDELSNKVMATVSDDIKLGSGSLIEISKLPGSVLETQVKGEVVSKVESELLCRAYFNMYLGDDPFDKEAKEKFGAALLSLF